MCTKIKNTSLGNFPKGSILSGSLLMLLILLLNKFYSGLNNKGFFFFSAVVFIFAANIFTGPTHKRKITLNFYIFFTFIQTP